MDTKTNVIGGNEKRCQTQSNKGPKSKTHLWLSRINIYRTP